MVFGNMGDDSGTGVAFTRDPATGENKFYGEFLINAQGEDVVAGIRTPQPVSEMSKWNKKCYDQLIGIKDTLEQHYKDLCVAELRKAALNRLEKSIETRVGSRTLALGRTLVREARDELEKFTPYVSTLKRLQSFGDTMHGLGRPSGYMERLFEGIRASTYVHEDPAAADEAWAQIQKVRSDFARDLQDLGLPESFSETRRQIEKWFSQQ